MVKGFLYFGCDFPRVRLVEKSGGCGDPGPEGTVCTQKVGHTLPHEDSDHGKTWSDNWRERAPQF